MGPVSRDDRSSLVVAATSHEGVGPQKSDLNEGEDPRWGNLTGQVLNVQLPIPEPECGLEAPYRT
jgi:hypothetical protein